jgi:hypothetical protein
LIDLKTDPPKMGASPERRSKPISQQEKELTEALDFLVRNLRDHMEDYHHKTDRQQVNRCESILEDAISELIAVKNGGQRQATPLDGGRGSGESAVG